MPLYVYGTGLPIYIVTNESDYATVIPKQVNSKFDPFAYIKWT